MTSVIIRYYRSKPTRSGFGCAKHLLTPLSAVIGIGCIRTAAVGNVDGKASGCGKGKFVRKRVVFGKVILIAFIAGTVVSVRRRTVEVSALAGRHTGTVGNRIHNTPAAGF